MKIVLIGYMGSGKTTLGKLLAAQLNFLFCNLDSEIEKTENLTISEMFSKKGEIYFRKKEILTLNKFLQDENKTVIATGGGTPCYGNTMNKLLLDKNVLTIYLKSSIDILVKRLFKEKNQRPIISHCNNLYELKDFVSKHLFERSYDYNRAEITINTDNLSLKEIMNLIIVKLF
jgi:shikimate kinase